MHHASPPWPLPAAAPAAASVVIEVTRLVGRRIKGRLPTGVDRVALAYIQHFGAGELASDGRQPPRPPAHALLRLGRWCWVLTPALSQQLFAWLLQATPDAAPSHSGWRWWAKLCRQLPATLAANLLPDRGLGPQPWLVNVLHSGLEHAHWAQALRRQGARPLLLVHDLIPLSHPQFCRAGEAERHARRMRHLLAWAHAVVANSQATLDALRDWAAQQQLALPPATVAHLGTGHPVLAANPAALGAPAQAPWAVAPAASPAALPATRPCFVVLGTLEPRKNHGLLLALWPRLVQRHGPAAAPRLVLIGQHGWEIEHLLRQLQRTPELQGLVLQQPHCSDAELAAWLRQAKALLFPSFVEGFGMPLTEALAAGVPVLASDLPVFREVAGNVPDYLDPLDGPGWLAALEDYAADGPRRRAQQQRLRGYTAPTWASHFAAVTRLMAQVSGQASGPAAARAPATLRSPGPGQPPPRGSASMTALLHPDETASRQAVAETSRTPPPTWRPADPATLHVWRFSAWKQAILPSFMPASRLVFVSQAHQVPPGATLLAWGRQALPAPLAARVGHDLQHWQAEDGFLRSAGLGADLVKPLSWVIDSRGLYLDATRPSDLETLLQDGSLVRALAGQGAQLRQRIVDGALTKYNLAGRPWQRPAGQRSVVLVPGQVESDASLRWGSPALRSNLELLMAVRRARPQAWVVYKPHPDVVAGLRARGPQEAEAARWCNEVVTHAPMDQLLAQVDELHTLTSLSGFEALLRGLPVTCWGQPFYAGWGLTDDRCPPPRRSRRLGLDELVAGALIAYPRYARRATGAPCGAAEAVQDLLTWRGAHGARPSLLQRCLRPLLGWRKP